MSPAARTPTDRQWQIMYARLLTGSTKRAAWRLGMNAKVAERQVRAFMVRCGCDDPAQVALVHHEEFRRRFVTHRRCGRRDVCPGQECLFPAA